MILPDYTDLLIFSISALAVILIPGPATIYIVTKTSDYGLHSGILSTLGIGVGTIIHTIFAAIGLSAIITSATMLHTALRFVGASFFIYLGIQRVLSKNVFQQKPALSARNRIPDFRDGILTALLNPKSALFILVFLPQFIDYQAGDAGLQIAVFGVLFATLGTVLGCIYALLTSTALKRIAPHTRNHARLLSYAYGGAYSCIGLYIALL